MRKVFKMNLNTSANKVINTLEFCKSRGIIGMGWALLEQSTNDWFYYKILAEKDYGRDAYDKSKAFHTAVSNFEKMRVNDLVWVSGASDDLFLCEVLSDPYCNYGKNYVSADVVSMRKCRYIEFGKYGDLAKCGLKTSDVVPVNTVQPIKAKKVVDWTLEEYMKLTENLNNDLN